MSAATWAMTSLLLVAGATPPDTFYFNQRSFQIPLTIHDDPRTIQQVKLFLAGPDGKTWEPRGTAAPDERGFTFTAPDDGAYVFKTQVVYKGGRAEPDDVAAGGKAKTIVVDTVRPVVRVLSAERQADDVAVRWEVQELNPNWESLRLEYLASDAAGTPWTAVAVAEPQLGHMSFHVVGPVVAVRVAMADLAKNDSGWAEQPVKGGAAGLTTAGATGGAGLPPVTPGSLPSGVAPDLGKPGSDGGSWSPAGAAGGAKEPLPPIASGTGRSAVLAAGNGDGSAAGGQASLSRPARAPLPPAQLVNKRVIYLGYEVTKFGPSGVKSVDLYCTRDDGLTWQPCGGEDNIGVPPADAHGAAPSLKRSLKVELQADGVFGFCFVVKSGAGLGGKAPQRGDVPQIRVEVDTTAPKADLFKPEPHPTRRDTLILHWTASDNKIGPAPITLQWAEAPDAEWHAIGADLPNTGEFAWQVPANVPPHVYLRLTVRDLAGNEAVAQTEQPVLVDLNEPEVRPIRIDVNPR